jgi:hypothetical protein
VRVLVLVEVRSRSRSDYGQAAATIGLIKQRRCSLAARGEHTAQHEEHAESKSAWRHCSCLPLQVCVTLFFATYPKAPCVNLP